MSSSSSSEYVNEHLNQSDMPSLDTDQPMDWRVFQRSGYGGSICAYADYAMAYLKHHKQKATAKHYRYLITFTLDPKKKPDVVKAKDWILRNVVNTLHKPEEVYYSEELTKKGVPHWHVVGSYSKSLKKSLFKYYLTKYGNIDFSRTLKGEGLKSGLSYLQKEEQPIKLYPVFSSQLDQENTGCKG